MDKEQEGVEEVKEEVVEEVAAEEVVDEKVEEEGAEHRPEDRPVRNYAAELERKNREIERLRSKVYAPPPEKPVYNPNDITTWSDQELRVLLHSQEPQHLNYKPQAQDILDDRRLERKLAEREAVNKRVKSEMELRSKFPEALDETSEFSIRMEEVLHELDLTKSPAGRLAAAKIVAAELSKGKTKVQAKGRKAEEARLADVKGHLSEGDRPNTKANEDSKAHEDLMTRVKNGDEDAMLQAIMKRHPNPYKK